MRNLEIAAVLRMIADILEIKGENPFKVRAYRQAVLALENLPEDIDRSIKAGKMQPVPGIGKGIGEKIEELVRTGKLDYYEKLKETLPRGLVEMMEIPNVGPKTVNALFKNLGIESIEELEKSAEEGRLQKLERFGEKTEQNILKGIRFLKNRTGKMMLGPALTLAESIVGRLNETGRAEKIEVAGSLRRMKETVGDIDLLAVSGRPDSVMNAFTKMPEVTRVLAMGGKKASVILENTVQADLRTVPPDSFGAAMQYFTGSKQHNIKLRERAQRNGLKLNEYGLFDIKSGRKIAGPDEAGVYAGLGLPYIEPELREDRGEIEAAMEGVLPDLVREEDVKGDLHVHSDWSDGVDSLEDLARAAAERSYEYIAVCDHSGSLKVAGGLDADRKLKQIEEIRRLNRDIEGVEILAGAEVDILPDGTLDYDDELLQKLDIVIAAIHSGFRQDKKTLTGRTVKAMNNPFVNIIAHPTGRLINQRDAYEIDMETVIKEAAGTGTFLELNCFPDRLDINDVNCREAGAAGVMVSLGSDCHNSKQLHVIRYGVGVARRGWLEKSNILNTLSAGVIKKMAAAKRRRE